MDKFKRFLTRVLLPTILLGMVTGISIGLLLPSAKYVANPKENIFVLGDDMLGGKGQYAPLVKALDDSERGDQITIILRENNGGYVYNEYYIRDAILRSKARVTTIVDGWASSAAISVLFSGDYVRINKHEHVGVAHLSSPRTPQSVAYDIHHSRFYKRFMTQKEWDRMVAGEDVVLEGKTVCKTASEHVVQEDRNFCIVQQDRENTY